MGTYGYRYNQICVRIHLIMGSQIPVYNTVDTRLATVLVTDIIHEYPCEGVFLPPLLPITFLRDNMQLKYLKPVDHLYVYSMRE